MRRRGGERERTNNDSVVSFNHDRVCQSKSNCNPNTVSDSNNFLNNPQQTVITIITTRTRKTRGMVLNLLLKLLRMIQQLFVSFAAFLSCEKSVVCFWLLLACKFQQSNHSKEQASSKRGEICCCFHFFFLAKSVLASVWSLFIFGVKQTTRKQQEHVQTRFRSK